MLTGHGTPLAAALSLAPCFTMCDLTDLTGISSVVPYGSLRRKTSRPPDSMASPYAWAKSIFSHLVCTRACTHSSIRPFTTTARIAGI